MVEHTQAVEKILDQLDKSAEDKDKVAVGDVVAAFGSRGWGPFLLVPALLELSPVGGIPGVPTLLAAILALFAVQIAWGRHHMWLPGFLERARISSGRMEKAVDWMRPVARWLDRWFGRRLSALTTPRVTRWAAGCVMLLCLTVPPLELFPFASSAPMAAIAAFGLALTLRDGLLMALGFALSLLAVGVLGYVFLVG